MPDGQLSRIPDLGAGFEPWTDLFTAIILPVSSFEFFERLSPAESAALCFFLLGL